MSRASSYVPSYRLYREKTGEIGDFWLHCEAIRDRTLPHNYEIALHRHDALFQIFLITSGGGEMVRDDGSREFAAPCALFLPHGVAHGFRFARDIDGLVITALADRLQAVAASDRQIADFAAVAQIVALTNLDTDPVARAVRAIADELTQPQPGRHALLEALMAQAIINLVRIQASSNPKNTAAGSTHRHRMDDLAALIGSHYREHKPVAYYADRLGITPTHLTRLARAQTGLTVQELIARRIVEAARRDLVFSDVPIQTIAYTLGFADPAYFNRFFRREMGTTPGAFRQAERRRLTG